MTQHIVDPSEVLLELGLSASVTEEQRAMVLLAITDAEGAIRRCIRYDPTLGQHVEYHPQQSYQSQGGRGIWEVTEERAVLRQVSEAATSELQLQHIPIRYATDSTRFQVWLDYDGRFGSRSGSFADSTKKTMGDDFWPNADGFDDDGQAVCHDGIVRALGMWPTTPGTVKLSYWAGYSDDELRGRSSNLDATPIWQTAREEAARRVRRMLAMKSGALGVPAGVKSSESLGDYSYTLDSGLLTQLIGGGELTQSSTERLSDFVNMGFILGS